MAAPEPTVTTVDLRTDVPAGWTLAGLSEPKFDGVNYYRVPQAPTIDLSLRLDSKYLIEIEYQVYSPNRDMLVSLFSNGELISYQIFKKGDLRSIQKNSLIYDEGEQRIEIKLPCSSDKCLSDIRVYRTAIKSYKLDVEPWKRSIGFSENVLILDSPGSFMKIKGAGPLSFDGRHLFRKVIKKDLEISWPSAQAVNASLTIYAPQSFFVTTRVAGQVVDRQQGHKDQAVNIAVSLMRFPSVRSLTVSVECLGVTSTQECAYVYFPSVTVNATPPVTGTILAGAVLVAVTGMAALWRLLAPVRA